MNNAYTLCDEECEHTPQRQSVRLQGSTPGSALAPLLLSALKAVGEDHQVGPLTVVVVVVGQEKKGLKVCQFSRKAT